MERSPVSLCLKNVHMEVRGFRLQNISLEVAEGKCLVVVGPSGAGKTLLLDTIAGLYLPKEGSITLAGQDITRALPEERNLGYLPQNLALFPRLSVMENILFGARARKIPPARAQTKVQELAELLGIEHLLARDSPATLSGGEKQRVALARALLVEPAVLLLDEPLSALDSVTKRQLILYLRQVFASLRLTVVYVTHDLQEAFLLADTLGVMRGGRLEQVGPREEICYRPATLGVARMFTGSNFFSGRLVEVRPGAALLAKTRGGALWELPWREGLGVGDEVVFGISPRDVMIIRAGRPLRPSVQANLFAARVIDILDGYSSCLVFLEVEPTGERAELELPGYLVRDLNLRTGSLIEVSFKKDCLWVLPAREGETRPADGETKGRLFRRRDGRNRVVDGGLQALPRILGKGGNGWGR